jgi:formylmethanofuran dehydrogenase subunit E|tara:strand:+ start:1111 stop:1302 length:192 start_codon:yes stop_codon:yes gene_type:complete
MPSYTGNASAYYGLPTASEEAEADAAQCARCGRWLSYEEQEPTADGVMCEDCAETHERGEDHG